jgi:hypothetical protein
VSEIGNDLILAQRCRKGAVHTNSTRQLLHERYLPDSTREPSTHGLILAPSGAGAIHPIVWKQFLFRPRVAQATLWLSGRSPRTAWDYHAGAAGRAGDFSDGCIRSDRHCVGESWTKSICFEGRKVKIPERTV